MIRALLFALALALLAGASLAGDIHPNLAAELTKLSGDESIQVIVHMAEQAPIAALDADLKQRRASRLDRHRDVVLALKDAARSQAPLRA